MSLYKKLKPKIAIIGASAPACIYALYLKKKNFDVTIFEGSSSIGGAWSFDRFGPKYSNIIYPLTANEKKIFKKSVNFLKNYGVRFKNNFSKSLFSKKIVNSNSCDFKGLYNLAKKKIKIKKNHQVKSIVEKENSVLINNQYSFQYVFFPTYIKLKTIKIVNKKRVKNIRIPFLKMNKALHMRIVVSNLKKESYNFKDLTLGPLDRFQIINLNKSLSQINGRVLLNWKNKDKKKILQKICEMINFKKMISSNFFVYRSCIRDDKQIKLLKNKLKETKKIKYLETFTLLEFLRINIFNNSPLKSL